jgi:predicted MFS family arabinose efflux permease
MSDVARPARTLGRRASFQVAAAVVAHTLWTSAAPAVTYPLYAARWHLTTTVTTGMFAVYPVAVVLTLLLFGNLSDRVGRRAAILAGVASSLLGVGLFAVAPNVAWLYVGRAFMGIGVGLSTSPATAALVEFSAPGEQARANVVATAATAFGLGMATLGGGALIQYAPWPLHLNFIALSAILAVVLAFAWFLPRPTPVERAAAPRWRPGTLGVPRSMARVFATATTAVTAGYVLGALMLSLGSQIARDLIGSSNALVHGAVLALFALATGVTAVFARPLPGGLAVRLGGVTTAAALGLLLVAASRHALLPFLLAAGLSGVGYSLLFLGGLTLVNAHAPARHRAGTLSAIYLIGYLLMGATALALGALATRRGLGVAIEIGASGIAALALAAAALAWPATPRRDDGPAPRRQVGSET